MVYGFKVHGLGFNVWGLLYSVSNVWFGVEGQNDEQIFNIFCMNLHHILSSIELNSNQEPHGQIIIDG